jgi:hypothetical protein
MLINFFYFVRFVKDWIKNKKEKQIKEVQLETDIIKLSARSKLSEDETVKYSMKNSFFSEVVENQASIGCYNAYLYELRDGEEERCNYGKGIQYRKWENDLLRDLNLPQVNKSEKEKNFNQKLEGGTILAKELEIQQNLVSKKAEIQNKCNEIASFLISEMDTRQKIVPIHMLARRKSAPLLVHSLTLARTKKLKDYSSPYVLLDNGIWNTSFIDKEIVGEMCLDASLNKTSESVLESNTNGRRRPLIPDQLFPRFPQKKEKLENNSLSRKKISGDNNVNENTVPFKRALLKYPPRIIDFPPFLYFSLPNWVFCNKNTTPTIPKTLEDKTSIFPNFYISSYAHKINLDQFLNSSASDPGDDVFLERVKKAEQMKESGGNLSTLKLICDDYGKVRVDHHWYVQNVEKKKPIVKPVSHKWLDQEEEYIIKLEKVPLKVLYGYALELFELKCFRTVTKNLTDDDIQKTILKEKKLQANIKEKLMKKIKKTSGEDEVEKLKSQINKRNMKDKGKLEEIKYASVQKNKVGSYHHTSEVEIPAELEKTIIDADSLDYSSFEMPTLPVVRADDVKAVAKMEEKKNMNMNKSNEFSSSDLVMKMIKKEKEDQNSNIVVDDNVLQGYLIY